MRKSYEEKNTCHFHLVSNHVSAWGSIWYQLFYTIAYLIAVMIYFAIIKKKEVKK